MSLVQPCAGAIVFDDVGRLLLVRRGRDPGRGLWSVPGGKCLPGESPANACVREVREETGLRVRITRAVGRVQRAGIGDVVYDITDYLCRVQGGEGVAGDDADDISWVTAAQLEALDVVEGLREFLVEHDLMPR